MLRHPAVDLGGIELHVVLENLLGHGHSGVSIEVEVTRSLTVLVLGFEGVVLDE